MWTDETPDIAIAPSTKAEALIFARQYLSPEQQADYLTAFENGTALRDWLALTDDSTREAVKADSMCVLLDFLPLPYAQRLDATRNERQRFEKWRGTDHVC